MTFDVSGPPQGRAGAVIIRDGEVLLIYRKNDRGEYWVVPGGHVEPGESPEVAVARELQEEAGLTVKVGEKLYEKYDETVNQHMYFFAAEIVGDESEVKWREGQQEGNVYRFEWVDRD